MKNLDGKVGARPHGVKPKAVGQQSRRSQVQTPSAHVTGCLMPDPARRDSEFVSFIAQQNKTGPILGHGCS